MKDKAIAIASIAFMLIAASSVLFDRFFAAYAIALIYAIVRWKISEQQGLIVKENYVKWLLRAFIVICCVIFGAGGNMLSTPWEKVNLLLSGLINLLGFVFAYDIGRYFNKITVSQKADIPKNNEDKVVSNLDKENKNLKVENSIEKNETAQITNKTIELKEGNTEKISSQSKSLYYILILIFNIIVIDTYKYGFIIDIFDLAQDESRSWFFEPFFEILRIYTYAIAPLTIFAIIFSIFKFKNNNEFKLIWIYAILILIYGFLIYVVN